jgi:cytochrome c oxidase subunit I
MVEKRGPAAITSYLTATDARVIRWQLYLAFIAFGWGIFAGVAQALDRILPQASSLWHLFPGQKNYYQGLTAHGVLMVLVFTFAFMNAFQILVTSHSLKRSPNKWLLQGSFFLMLIGVAMAGLEIVSNRASVLFTMYPPLQATPVYYLGLVLVVVSTWLMILNVLLMYRSWRKDNPGERTPLQAFAVLCNSVLWLVASLPLAIEVLVLLVPWSLGIVPKTDPQLARSLFWFTGHAIVYVWLLPAYISWYTMIPKQVSGKLFSDGIVRLVFLIFLILSIPTGFHHQYTDPGIPVAMKNLHLILTFGIFFPSLITAFTIMAALENGGRNRGGTGLLGWIRKLPWGDPSVSGQILAMLAFILGGISGLVNASYSLNLMVHNTAWVPGHFHLTVGTAVALSFLAISYWLVPHLTGKALWGRKLAVLQGWLWFFGVLIMSRGLVVAGLGGEARRMNVSLMPEPYRAAIEGAAGALGGHALTAFGGTLMFISGLLFFVVMLMTLLNKQTAEVEMPVSECMIPASKTPHIFDRWPVWVGIMLLLILIAYGPFFLTYTPNFVSPGFKVWGGPQ